MEIPGLELLSRNCGADVGASAIDWQTRIYANRCESQFEEGVRLWEVAIPKMKINHEETKSTKINRNNLRALRFFVVDFPQEVWRWRKRRTLARLPQACISHH
jgi:hypothetical protein